MKKIIQLDYDEDTLEEVEYLKVLILEKIKRLEELEDYYQLDIEKFMNKVYLSLAKEYYKENNENIIIDESYEVTSEEKERIFEWMNNKRRYELYNVLIQKQYNLLTRIDDYGNIYDQFINNNIYELMNYIQQDILTNEILTEDIFEYDAPKLTTKELETLMEEYLTEIDPTLKWLNIYKEAMEKGNIVYTFSELDWYCANEYGENMISAPLSNTLTDFPNLVHEFAHYIANLNVREEDYICNAIREYPSLFFERHAIHFLRKKGYNEQDINRLLDIRNFYTQNNEKTASSALLGIISQQEYGKITKEKKIKQCTLEQTDKIQSIIKKYIFGIVDPTEESINDYIDEENEFILKDKLFFNNSYPYIIAAYLTTKSNEKLLEDPSLIETILEITENLVNENVKTITEKLNITIEFNLEDKPKQYTKKEQD